MGKKCIQCGAELEDSAVFCDECGAPQTAPSAPSTQPTAPQPNPVYQQPVDNAAGQTGAKNSKMGIASFVLGIVSICSCGSLFVTQILGIIFGVIALKDKTTKHGLPTAGVITSAISFLFLLILFI